MMTSSNGTFSALLALCAGNSPVTGEFSSQRPVTRSFGVFFDLDLNKRLSKQWNRWWFETPSCPLWRHRNVRQKCWELEMQQLSYWYIYIGSLSSRFTHSTAINCCFKVTNNPTVFVVIRRRILSYRKYGRDTYFHLRSITQSSNL